MNLEYKTHVDERWNRSGRIAVTPTRPDGSYIEVIHWINKGKIYQSDITKRWGSGQELLYGRAWKTPDLVGEHSSWLQLTRANRSDVWWSIEQNEVIRHISSGRASTWVYWKHGGRCSDNIRYYRRDIHHDLRVTIAQGYRNKLLVEDDYESTVEDKATRIKCIVRELRFWNWRKAARKFVHWHRAKKSSEKDDDALERRWLHSLQLYQQCKEEKKKQ